MHHVTSTTLSDLPQGKCGSAVGDSIGDWTLTYALPVSIYRWNFFISQQALVIFEVVAFGLFLGYWPSARDLNQAITITLMIVAYFCLNIWTAKVSREFADEASCISDGNDLLQFFANAEFCFAMGKILLIVGLLFYTVCLETMFNRVQS